MSKKKSPRGSKSQQTKFKTATQDALRKSILDLIHESDKPLTRTQIGKALNIKGAQRYVFKEVINQMHSEGQLDRSEKRRLLVTNAPAIPKIHNGIETLAVEVIDVDDDGELFAEPFDWNETHQGSIPRIHLVDLKPSYRQGHSALGITSRLIVRIVQQGDTAEKHEWQGIVLRRLVKDKPVHIGVFYPNERGGSLSSVNRKDAFSGVHVPTKDCAGLTAGDVVQYTVEEENTFKIIKKLGQLNDPHIFSQIAIHNHNLPHTFSPEAIKIAESGEIPPLGNRTDFRDIDLVTIDGEDARDFDDAVWAQADEDPQNNGGWRALVAIADVSYYVRPNSQLDNEARERGNSVYFPDRVVPMLPEALSNELCSLKPNVDRACMAIEMIITATGRLKNFRVRRGLMQSRARLTYNQVQNAIDGNPDETTAPLVEKVITPLYGVYQSLLIARQQRGTLDLDMPERQILFDDKGDVKDIVLRERYDSHKLIEELMIAANVAAAKTLVAKNAPCLFRIHDAPDNLKVANVRQFLKQYKLQFPKTDKPTPAQFNAILHKANGKPFERMVNELILRSQSQAKYSPDNIGHFGLSLSHYAHFTSPIRRYADLVVHRSLIGALELGEGSYDTKALDLVEIGDHISKTERAASAAEYEVIDRFAIAYVSQHVGEDFTVIITGLNRAGLFVEMPESGAEGFIPKRTLGGDTLHYDEAHHRLINRRSNLSYQLGDKLRVTLVEANTTTNSLVFKAITNSNKAFKGISRKDNGSLSLKKKKHASHRSEQASTKDMGKNKQDSHRSEPTSTKDIGKKKHKNKVSST